MLCEKCGFYTDDPRSSHISQHPRVIVQHLCSRCYSRKYDALMQVNSAKLKAKKYGAPATLTWEEWLETKEHFDFRCVYCGGDNAEALDHFVPLTSGGASSKDNCVPACKPCNSKKGKTHPDKLTSIRIGVIRHIRSYLASRK